MQNGVSGKPVLRRKERNTASRLFGFGSRGNKLEWVSGNTTHFISPESIKLRSLYCSQIIRAHAQELLSNNYW